MISFPGLFSDLIYILSLFFVFHYFLGLQLNKEKRRFLLTAVLTTGVLFYFRFQKGEVERALILLLFAYLITGILYVQSPGRTFCISLTGIALLSLLAQITELFLRIALPGDFQAWIELPVSVLVLLLLCFFYLFIRHFYHIEIYGMSNKFLLLLTGILCLDTGLVFGILAFFELSGSGEMNVIAVLLFALLGMLIVIQLLLLGHVYLSREAYREKEEILEQMLKDQAAYYAYLEERDRLTRSFRHDIRGLMLTLKQLQAEGKWEEMERLLGEMSGTVENFGRYRSLNHATAEAVVGRFLAEAEGKGISLEVKGMFPSHCTLSSMTVSIVLDNVLRNAFEAVEGCGEKWVRMDIRFKGQELLLEESNACAPGLVIGGELPDTSKADHYLHGIGLRNIRKCVERNAGWMQLQAAEGVYCIRIMMRCGGEDESSGC